jgi:hypothetical protein
MGWVGRSNPEIIKSPAFREKDAGESLQRALQRVVDTCILNSVFSHVRNGSRGQVAGGVDGQQYYLTMTVNCD